MKVLRRNLALVAVALLALPLATAARAPLNSGEQSKSAARIFADAETAMLHAKNFHVLAHLVEGSTALSLNLSMSPDGGGGSIIQPGVDMNIIVAGKYVYVKADYKTWLSLKEKQSTAKTLAGKWIKAPSSTQDFADFVDLTVSTTFVDQFVAGPGKLSKLPRTTKWDGQGAIVLTDTSGDRIYVADSGAPYLLRIAGTGSQSVDTIDFSDYGTAAMPAVPTAYIALPG